MNTRIILIISILQLAFNAFGTIKIESYSHSSDGCNGTIQVLAEGDAYPFIVQLFIRDNTSPTKTIIISDYYGGIALFEGLCEGDYEILVIDKAKCEKKLYQNIQKCSTEDRKHKGYH